MIMKKFEIVETKCEMEEIESYVKIIEAENEEEALKIAEGTRFSYDEYPEYEYKIKIASDEDSADYNTGYEAGYKMAFEGKTAKRDIYKTYDGIVTDAFEIGWLKGKKDRRLDLRKK